MKHFSYLKRLLVITCIALPHINWAFMITQNDPYPLHSSLYPWAFLNTHYKEYHAHNTEKEISENTHFSLTPFAQKATAGTDNEKTDITNLGDLYGKWNMVGLLYGTIPAGQTQPALLTVAGAQTYQDGQNLSDPDHTDKGKQLGFFSIPLKYRKTGIRFEWAWKIDNYFVFTLQGGLADIKQTTTPPEDESGSASTLSNVYGNAAGIANLSADIATVQTFLTDPDVAQQIFDQLGYDNRNFNKVGAEDLFLSLTWRDHFFINTGKNRDSEWTSVTIMPFITLKGLLGFGSKKETNQLFGLPCGNNGHHGIQVVGGVSFDFTETIEVSAKIGGTHYFSRNITDMYIPNHKSQSGIYPYATDVKYEPGKSWFFTVGCNSYRFLDKLSMYAEYYYIQHEKDSISLLTPDSAFIPSVLEDLSCYNVQGMNLGMTYELSPYVTLGGVWQLPIAQRNAYKNNTIALNLVVIL